MAELQRIVGMRNSSITEGDMSTWFMMDSPWPTITLTSLYLYFVLWLGPSVMAPKKAFDLKKVILLYNTAQVVFSTWWVIQCLAKLSQLNRTEIIDGLCRPYRLSEDKGKEFDELAWYYFMSKFMELLDTIFFVLRRKQNQVTFLHVYHHTNMAVSTWAFVKYVRGSQIMVLGLCNTFVHVVMYAYYLLAAMGPSIQKYLWWKKYITRMQMVQFIVIIFYLLGVMLGPCHAPSSFITFAVCNTLSFLLLFYQFYIKAYTKQKTA